MLNWDDAIPPIQEFKFEGLSYKASVTTERPDLNL